MGRKGGRGRVQGRSLAECVSDLSSQPGFSQPSFEVGIEAAGAGHGDG